MQNYIQIMTIILINFFQLWQVQSSNFDTGEGIVDDAGDICAL